ncbi:ferric reductase transmembrane component 7 [Metarhizium album ARSEF 1941]|uniref:ferric-chelate reductase (NADPH) n=1 Tax=Metarhizium album (strain ARSEF 1941) TaxID=1081103 RepID=A0A0B2X459_METAS|nr:ferric reductase transmembrane component 7 [Metarhizium album ARSEF 1941]KHO00205.1 ferric reductase transmembrane component 7 [Metarhizium album ARSEF 1941]
MAPSFQTLSIRDATAQVGRPLSHLAKRINIPSTPTSPPGLLQANAVDPWRQSGKYGLGWTYFALSLLACVLIVRIWHYWQDKIRQAIYKQEVEDQYRNLYHIAADYAFAAQTGQSQQFFPDGPSLGNKPFRPKAHFSSVGIVNDTLALFRWVFYRPIPDIVWGKNRLTFSSLAVLACGFITLVFVTLYCFLQQPLYWESIRFGSPPVAIRSGVLAVAMTPWIIVTSMKANILTLIIGIGPDRLNVFHRWLGYICLFLSLVHMIPFYIQPVWEDEGMTAFNQLFPDGSGVIYGTGIACLVPLVWLCVASLPWIRRVAYEIFVILHVPAGVVYVGLLFWHTKNALLTWDYLYATIAIWALAYIMRVFKLNWLKPWRNAFMVGDEAAVSLIAENAIKITIPTQMRWKPGQYVYLRMPCISLLDNHPFTISSLCSEDFPSEYGENYRDCVLVFKPFKGFTRKVLDTAIANGPFHTYRAFLDGPYGGMRRELAAFDTCILIAGGSGITSLMSQLLNLIKRMRDGKAITRKVVVLWAFKRFEAMDWFREELRICREAAPPESVTCKFFVTRAVDHRNVGEITAPIDGHNSRVLDHTSLDKVDGFVAGIAPKHDSVLIQAEAGGNPEKERELREENKDRITALPPQKYLQPYQHPQVVPPLNRLGPNGYPEDKKELDVKQPEEFHSPPLDNETPPHFDYSPLNPNKPTVDISKVQGPYPVRAPELAHMRHATILEGARKLPTCTVGPPAEGGFGLPKITTQFRKDLTRSATPPQEIDGGWSMEYGRPDLGQILKEWATGGADGRGILGRRTAVFVCGPPSMRVGVANTVARLQAEIWGDDELEEIFLHAENYAL